MKLKKEMGGQIWSHVAQILKFSSEYGAENVDVRDV